MYQFYYKMNEDETYTITGCSGEGETAILPNNLKYTVIFDDVFKGHKELTKVVFPDTITDIGAFVFDGCENLKELTLPPYLKNFWQYALTRCGIEEISIPGSVEHIIPFVFNECKNLKTVYIKEGTKKILGNAFRNCTNLQDVYLPSSIEEVSEFAFAGCPNVQIHKR
ncbi:putative surface antigen BspA [Lachnospiraceae bacterium TWA4]|nr:putative surface antigen BspA [Lachnospiraceae bacterium TWA4]